MKMLENFFLALSAEPVLMFLNAANPSSLLRPMFLSVKLEFSSCSMKRPNSSQNFCSVETDHRHFNIKTSPFLLMVRQRQRVWMFLSAELFRGQCCCK